MFKAQLFRCFLHDRESIATALKCVTSKETDRSDLIQQARPEGALKEKSDVLSLRELKHFPMLSKKCFQPECKAVLDVVALVV